MNEIYSLDILKWVERMRVHNDDSKPSGIESGSALRMFENMIFPDTGLLTRRTGIEKEELQNQYVIKCNHDWKQYQGFTESYEYCSKCPDKR